MKILAGANPHFSMAEKDIPSPEWIAELRRRYTVEPEIDAVLTRKLERRAGGNYKSPSLAALSDSLQALLRAEIGPSFELSEATLLSESRSKNSVSRGFQVK